MVEFSLRLFYLCTNPSFNFHTCRKQYYFAQTTDHRPKCIDINLHPGSFVYKFSTNVYPHVTQHSDCCNGYSIIWDYLHIPKHKLSMNIFKVWIWIVFSDAYNCLSTKCTWNKHNNPLNLFQQGHLFTLSQLWMKK